MAYDTPPTALRVNLYPGVCAACRNPVAERAGYIHRIRSDAKWLTYCAADAPNRGVETHDYANGDEALAALDKALRASITEPPAPMVEAVSQASLDIAVETVALRMAKHMLQECVPIAERAALETLATLRTVEIRVNDRPPVVTDTAHRALPTILTALCAGAHPFLVGPAGSGKTTLASQCAKALGLPFYMAARVTSEFKLLGFTDANGRTVRTQFRDAFEHGGVFLFDEIDASDPDVATSFNAALANGVCDFPDGLIDAHANFKAIAAGNTYGRGADRQYVGRNQLDAATLDRFAVFDVDYDEALELALAGDDEWTKYVQSVRRAVEQEKVRHIVSPRASVAGAKLLAAGMSRAEVENAVIWKGLPQDARQRIEYRRASNGVG